jgi:hypothetical protein
VFSFSFSKTPRALFADDAVARALAAAVGVRLPCVARCAPASSSSVALPFPRRGRASGGSSRAEASETSSALALAARRLVVAVAAAGATSTSVCWPRLGPRRILFTGSGSGSGSGSGAVVVGAFVPRAVLRVGLLASVGSWSVASEDFVVVRERRTGSSLDAAGFALLADLAGAGAVSWNRAALVLNKVTDTGKLLPPSFQPRLFASFASRSILLARWRCALKVWPVDRQV